MYYKIELKDRVRVSPNLFDLDTKEAVIKSIKKKYDGYISKDLGVVIDVSGVKEVGEGVIIPGDGSSYYKATFEVLVFRPDLQEVVLGRIRDIVDFGAFITLGPIDGMIHVSQTMDDFVSFSKEKTLAGKDSKKSLKINDVCRARIIAVSYKDVLNPKLGLTMRQQGLGRLDWIADEEEKPEKKEEEKETKKDTKKKEDKKKK
jgi:DNA-directed RNA polymerase subunit E'|tara:strand:+ start:7888 stop:8496 length:609 start_codon:yes stop_codon:yes gene_type:complete